MVGESAPKVRIFRAKSALLEREPNQENAKGSPVEAQSFGFSLLRSPPVRFFDARELRERPSSVFASTAVDVRFRR